VFPATLEAQARPSGTPSQGQVPGLISDPAIRAQILTKLKSSGLTPDQIRAQLKGMGYSDEIIDVLATGSLADSTVMLSEDLFAAVKSLGIMDSTAVDSLRTPYMSRKRRRATTDTLLLDS